MSDPDPRSLLELLAGLARDIPDLLQKEVRLARNEAARALELLLGALGRLAIGSVIAIGAVGVALAALVNAVAPTLAIIGSVIAYLALELRAKVLGLLGSSLAIFGIIATAALSLFSFLMPSSVMPNAGFTVWDASSSQMTLFIMLCATVIFLPIILGYTAWVFWVMRDTVTPTSLNRNPNAY